MSKGTEFKPSERQNGKIMMRVNIQPMIIDRQETVRMIYNQLSYKTPAEIVKTKKNVVKNILRNQCLKLQYSGEIDEYYTREELIEYEPGAIRHWDAVEFLVDKHFPDFDGWGA